MNICPMTISEAKAFVNQHHRHHKCGKMQTGLFSIAVEEDGKVIAVAIVGRPVARCADDDYTGEVTRLCVLERWVMSERSRGLIEFPYLNASSMLYSACWRAARAMGYRKLITYTLATESGVSLRAAGWKIVGKVNGQSWNRKSRPRVDKHPTQDKLRWEP